MLDLYHYASQDLKAALCLNEGLKRTGTAVRSDSVRKEIVRFELGVTRLGRNTDASTLSANEAYRAWSDGVFNDGLSHFMVAEKK